jgi:hypothetical protein
MNARLLGLTVVAGSLTAQSGAPAVFRSYPTRGAWKASRCRPTSEAPVHQSTTRPAKPATTRGIGFWWRTCLQLGGRPAVALAAPCLPLCTACNLASRWPGSADSSTASNGHRDIAPVKVLTDTEHHRGPFEGVRICAFYRQFTAIRRRRSCRRHWCVFLRKGMAADPRSSDRSSDVLGVALWC